MTTETPTHTYKFENRRNSYFNGSDVVVTRDDGRELKLNGKDGMLAISVKDHTATSGGYLVGANGLPEGVYELAEDLNRANESRIAHDDWTQQWTEVLYRQASERFWDDAHELASEAGFERVYSAGRSGGWCCIAGTGEEDFHRITHPQDEDDREHAETIFGLLFDLQDAMADAREYFFDLIREEHAELEHEREQCIVRGEN
jgi:hypothetical protein